MLSEHAFVSSFAMGMMVMAAGPALAQNYPDKPIRIVTGGTGGGNDLVARLIAQGLTGSLGQQVIVDNRPSGTIPQEVVAKARPDGYTLILSGSGFWIVPILQANVLYDPVKDFSPITVPTNTPNILTVHPSLPVKSVKDLVALAKSRPGELNYGAAGLGASAHLGGELFKAVAGVDIVRINYKSVGAALTGLIAGQVHMTFGTAGSLLPHVKSGRLKALAVTSAQPSPLLPDLPTVAASGLPGYDLKQVFGIFAPAKTPEPIINKLHQEIVQLLNRADSKEALTKLGMEIVGSSPDQLAAMVKTDMARWSRVFKDAGVRPE